MHSSPLGMSEPPWNPGVKSFGQLFDEYPCTLDSPGYGPKLGGDDVHLWRVFCRGRNVSVGRLSPLLSKQELERARRFHFAIDRNRFVERHAALRMIRALYMKTPPQKLVLRATAFGKPFLVREPGTPPLFFNLSHSDEFAVYAFSRGRKIGIDIERIRPVAETDRIVNSFFSPRECAEFASLAPEQQLVSFFQGWTCKEAYVKARGIGLSCRLDRFHVSLTPGEPAKLLGVDDESSSHAWVLFRFSPAPGYIGALAVEGDGCVVRRWSWIDESYL